MRQGLDQLFISADIFAADDDGSGLRSHDVCADSHFWGATRPASSQVRIQPWGVTPSKEAESR